MKKVLAASMLLTFAAPVFAQSIPMPIVYGLINKEIRYVDQKKEMNFSKISNFVDVQNAETRLGARGLVPVNQSIQTTYNIMLGLDSSNNSTSAGAGAGRIRIRNADLSFITPYGTVFAGQVAEITTVPGIFLDPLISTGVGSAGVDACSYNASFACDYIKNATFMSIGYLERSRPDQIGYKTPEWNGLQYSTAAYRLSVATTPARGNAYLGWDDDITDNNSIAAPTATTIRAATRWNNLVGYKHKFNDQLSMYANIAYNKTSSIAFDTYRDYYLLASFTYGEFTLAGQYTNLKKEFNKAFIGGVDSKKTKENDLYQASFKWTRGNHTLATTYSHKSLSGPGANSTWAQDSDLGQYTQYAFGYLYQIHKNVNLRTAYAHYVIDTDNKNALHSTQFANKADTLIFGTMLTF